MVLRRWMKRQGFVEKGTWLWHHPVCKLVICRPNTPVSIPEVRVHRLLRDESVGSRPEIEHALRSAWRAQQWLLWLKNQGTKPSCLRGLELPWSFVETAFDATRKSLRKLPAHHHSWALHAASGHSTSQASFDGISRMNLAAPCWFCGEHAPATYQHVLWHCKGIAIDPQIQNELELHPLQAHLGWSLPTLDSDHNMAVLKRHAIVCELLAQKRRAVTDVGGGGL